MSVKTWIDENFFGLNWGRIVEALRSGGLSEVIEVKRTYTDQELLNLYSHWSEEFYAASFMDPDEWHVKRFKEWLEDPASMYYLGREVEDLEDYEIEFLEIYHKLEGEDGKEV